jgi:hypothetical protein
MNGLKEVAFLVLSHIIFMPYSIHNYLFAVSLKSSSDQTFRLI